MSDDKTPLNPKTVHDKYAEIQGVFQTCMEIQKLAQKHPGDAQMRKTHESMKSKILKLADEIKSQQAPLELFI